MGWTDYIPDWSSKDKLRLCSVYDALSALTAAVNERGSVLSSYTPLPTVNRLYPVKYYVDLIDAKIKSIVPSFVNHTINGGDFTGLDAIPMWTWSDILSSETEASISRLYPAIDWVWQMYQVVNKLRYIYKTPVIAGAMVYNNTTEGQQQNVFEGTSWNEALGRFNNAGVFEYYNTPRAYTEMYRANVNLDGTTYYILSCGSSQYIYPSFTVSFLLDHYCFARKITTGDIFQTIGGITLENTRILICSLPESQNADYYAFDYNNYLSAEKIAPIPPLDGADKKEVSFSIYNNIQILKFTGANGFTFKDW